MNITDKNTQWHPAFCSALRLDLKENKNDLDYHSEVGLNTLPIKMDLLVIKKSPNVIITKKIGKIFKGHNIFEYKSPDDSLNIDTFYKGIAYASLYKAKAAKVDEIKSNDITITFIRRRKPYGLMESLNKEGMLVEKIENGIYYVNSAFPYKIQIIVSKELDPVEYVWLTSLTGDISEEAAEQLLKEASKLTEKDDKEYSDSVIQVVVNKNEEVFKKFKEVPDVYEALAELMKPEIDMAREQGLERGLEQGRENLAFEMILKGRMSLSEASEELNLSEEDIIERMEERGYIEPAFPKSPQIG